MQSMNVNYQLIRDLIEAAADQRAAPGERIRRAGVWRRHCREGDNLMGSRPS